MTPLPRTGHGALTVTAPAHLQGIRHAGRNQPHPNVPYMGQPGTGDRTPINQPPLSGLFYDQELGTKLRTPRIGSTEWMKTRADHAAAIYNANYKDDGGRGDIIFIDPWTVICPNGESAAFHYHADALAWAIEQTQPSAIQQRLDAVQRAWRAS